MFSFVKNALFGASSKQEIAELRRENNEIKRDNEEIKGLLRELLTNKRKRDDDEGTVEDAELERNKRVHLDVPPTSTVNTVPPSSSIPTPSTSLPSIPPASTAPLTPPSSTPLPPAPVPSSTPAPSTPTPAPATSTPTPPPSSFVISAGSSVDLNNNNNNPAQSNNPTTTDSHNPTTSTTTATDSHNPTTESNNTTASNNTTTITTNNNAPPAKKDVMISFNCRTMTKFAEQLMEALEKTNKFDVFCCTKTLKLGEVYRVQISSATQKANIFICLLNAGWANSNETLSEYLVMEKKVNNGKGGAVFPIVFESDDNNWMEKPAVDWILSKYQGYFIKKEDTSNEDTWQGHIDKCVGQLCQENF